MRYAIGTPDDFEVVIPEAETTAEAYFGRGRYDYKLSDRLFYTVGAGWERNRFSGLDNRWLVDTGLGYIFVNNDRTSFRGAAGVTYTSEDYTVDDGQDGSFFGARAGWDFRQKLFSSTTLTHTLIADANLEDTDDLRAGLAARPARRHVEQARPEGQLAAALGQPAGARGVRPLRAGTGGNTGLTVARPLQGGRPGVQRVARLQLRPAQEGLTLAAPQCAPGAPPPSARSLNWDLSMALSRAARAVIFFSS